MEPDKFRESRQEINRMCENVHALIDQKALEASKEGYQEVNERLDILRPQAEGEIQERSVKNLGLKLKNLSNLISKLKPKSGGTRKKGKAGIEWTEERLAELAPAFLEKVFANMGDDDATEVCFGTTGKGIRPNYLIRAGEGDPVSFSGSSHKPNNKPVSGKVKNISLPFPRAVIQKILSGQSA